MMVGASTNVIANLGGLGLKSESDSGEVQYSGVYRGLVRAKGAVGRVDIGV